MDRFNELRSKGWVNLSKDEKAEYQELKAEFPDDVEAEKPVKEAKAKPVKEDSSEPLEGAIEKAPKEISKKEGYVMARNVIHNGKEFKIGDVVSANGDYVELFLRNSYMQ